MRETAAKRAHAAARLNGRGARGEHARAPVLMIFVDAFVGAVLASAT